MTSDSSDFLGFCRTAEAVRATTKRLGKAGLLGDYFTSLSDADLMLAARYFSGYCFPLSDQRTTNVGGAALFGALTEAAGIATDDLSATLVRFGDFGDAAEEVLQKNKAQSSKTLTLQELGAAFDSLAATQGSRKKLALLIEMLTNRSPLEAKYLVKLLAGDLRIGLKEGAVEDALARNFNRELELVRWANMLLGDIGQTAVLARHDRLAEAKMRLFHPIKFMLATPAADLDDVAKQMPPEFRVEDKYDGIRAQAHVALAAPSQPTAFGTLAGEVRVALFSRTLDDITRSFPDLVPALAELATDTRKAGRKKRKTENVGDGLILDGEIVPVKDGRVLPFSELQKRLGRKRLPTEVLESVPVSFVAFDALFAQGKVLLSESLSTRRRVLERLPVDGHRVLVAPSSAAQKVVELDDEFDAARARGNEGLMVKDPASIYVPGRRGRDWLKIKRALATLDVVVTAVERGHGRRHKVLSDYTFAVRAGDGDPTLLNVGKAYSGLTDAEIESLSQWFIDHTIKEFGHGRVRIVEPLIVLEVTFDRVQKSSRHKSGFALRFPRIVRIRADKTPIEIDTLATVQRLADAS